MPNISLHYKYHDHANYKNHGEAIFTNPDNLTLQQIDAALRAELLDDTWFYTSLWGLPDLHFEKFDDEIDHAFHEFELVEFTEQPATESVTIAEFIKNIPIRTRHRSMY